MQIIWQVLIQFIFRLTFGVAVSMAITSPRQVTSGFYRVHLWLLLGLNTLASLAVGSAGESSRDVLGPDAWRLTLAAAVGLAVLSYVGSVVWLYEQPAAGRALLGGIAALAAAAALAATAWRAVASPPLELLGLLSSSLLLGSTLTAMLLGHWYLNTPTMKLAPLRQLLVLMFASTLARGAVCASGLALVAASQPMDMHWWLFLALRWLAGLVAPLVLVVLAWQTLKIPNTQSATGILYAAVIVVFLGELTGQLLSAQAAYPL